MGKKKKEKKAKKSNQRLADRAKRYVDSLLSAYEHLVQVECSLDIAKEFFYDAADNIEESPADVLATADLASGLYEIATVASRQMGAVFDNLSSELEKRTDKIYEKVHEQNAKAYPREVKRDGPEPTLKDVVAILKGKKKSSKKKAAKQPAEK